MTGVLIVVALLSIAATAFFVIRSESRKGPACCEGKKAPGRARWQTLRAQGGRPRPPRTVAAHGGQSPDPPQP